MANKVETIDKTKAIINNIPTSNQKFINPELFGLTEIKLITPDKGLE